MPIRFLVSFVVFIIAVGSGIASADSAWSSSQKTELLQACYQRALNDASNQFKTMFGDQMPPLSYQAMVNAHAEQLAISCQCLVNRITGSYSSNQIITSRAEVISETNNLISEGGACAVNIGRVFHDMYDALPSVQARTEGEG